VSARRKPGEILAAMSLPTGVLTFCFTDVEGSSELWERQPEAMARNLVWHERLVASTIEVHRGHLIRSMGEGDSTVSVFASAADAVAQPSPGRWILSTGGMPPAGSPAAS
jgi:class 3 adenylate cyclase